MPRAAGRDVFARELRGSGRDDSVDLCVEFVNAETGELVFDVGGVWDCVEQDWSDLEPETCVRCELHPKQVEVALWFRDWLEARIAGETLDPPIYTLLLFGGTRAGKTKLAEWFALAFTVAVPDARIWAVQYVELERSRELVKEFAEILPDEWFDVAGATYQCVNGAMIEIKSAHFPDNLKDGRCDFAIVNEAQKVKAMAHNFVRMRLGDTSGLAVLAANPPNDKPEGEWVGDMYDESQAGRRENEISFYFHHSQNPHVNQKMIDSLRSTMSARDFDIEVEGKRKQPSNAVAHAYSVDNLAPIPMFGNVTTQAAARWGFGSRVTDLVGQDYDKSPHMAASVARVFVDPDDATLLMLWYYAIILVSPGNEKDLSNAMYQFGLDPDTTAIVGDNSGENQDVDRTPGGQSFTHMRRNGWRRIHKPDRRMDKNPDLIARFKNDNRLLCSADGVRRVYFDPDATEYIDALGREWSDAVRPARELVDAVRGYKRKNGKPDRRAVQAHAWDSMSYLNYRCFPPVVHTNPVGYESVKKRRRGRQFRRR